MKKIMSTTFVAIVLSTAVVNTVNARAQAILTSLTKQDMRKMVDLTDVLDKKVSKEEKRAAAGELIEMLQSNADIIEVSRLYVQREHKKQEIETKNLEMAEMNIGFFDLSNADYKKARNELRGLTSELKNMHTKINIQESLVGHTECKVIKYAVSGLIVALGLAAVNHAFGSPITTYITDRGGAWSTMRAYGEQQPVLNIMPEKMTIAPVLPPVMVEEVTPIAMPDEVV